MIQANELLLDYPGEKRKVFFKISGGRVVWEGVRRSKSGDIVIFRIDEKGRKKTMTIDNNREVFITKNSPT